MKKVSGLGVFKAVRRLAGLAVVGAVLAVAPVLSARADTTVFAAASTTNALNDLMAAYKAQTGKAVVASYAASSTLAKQVEQGAPASVFISANEQWMNYLAERNLIEPASRSNMLGNDLVLVAPKDAALSVLVTHETHLLPLLGADGRLSVGDPAHVPVGQYAKEALSKMGQWDELEPRLARANDVRAALALVERKEAPLGIVYATDAAVANVKVLSVFPDDSHEPIVYPVALLKGADADAKAFFDFMTSAKGKLFFAKYGFTVK